MRKIAVSFMLWYLRFFAKIQLVKFRPVIVGVGGASGKTSLSNFIYTIASKKFKTLSTKGKNSETGIPLTILNLKMSDYTVLEWLKALVLAPLRVFFDWKKFDILVAEMGIDGPFEPKNMSYLLKIVKPKIGVLTNISYEHSVYFEKLTKDKEKILDLTAKQEELLLKALPKEGTAVLNIDDSLIKKILGIKASKNTVSVKERSADFYIEKISVSLRNFNFSFLANSERFNFSAPQALPNHYACSLVLAIAACQALGFTVEEGVKILEKNFSIPAGRLSMFSGKNETIIIDSSYNNATLAPIIDTLEFLSKVSGERRKVVILGDMRELGVMSKNLHEKVAEKILETSDLVFLIGPLCRKFIAPILQRNKHKFYSFNTFSEAKNVIKEKIERKDIILIKSSQNTLFLERAVEMLLKNPGDRKKLARRGKFWDKIRSQTL